MKKSNAGSSELLLAFLFTVFTVGSALFGLPAFIVGGGAFLTIIMWIDGAFNWFNDWFMYQEDTRNQRHKELIELLSHQHRETINFTIGELRRIHPPPPEAPPLPHDPGIIKLPPRKP